jgi:hypothetical protein
MKKKKKKEAKFAASQKHKLHTRNSKIKKKIKFMDLV